MKRKHVWCALLLALLLLSGCAQEQSQLSYIGAEKAKTLALECAGLTASEVEAITADLNTREGTDYYQVDITVGGEHCQYDIDALSGVVIETRTPDTAAESGQTTENTAGAALTAEEAKARALAHAGLGSGQATFVKAKLDHENGRQVYDVEFYTADGTEYDCEIDAASGEVVKFERDAKGSSAASGGSAITAEKAKELALAQVPGATAADIREFKTDYDDGRTEYEGKIVYGGMEYEFEIDGYSGAFRHWEAESVGR
ncbi:MAG: PepSY domain-containing protein [Oscillospiraceae bacterium]